MKLLKRTRAALLAARIEYHWWFVLRCRKKGEKWLSRGEPLSSGRLLRLNKRMDFHGLRAKKHEKNYEMLYILP